MPEPEEVRRLRLAAFRGELALFADALEALPVAGLEARFAAILQSLRQDAATLEAEREDAGDGAAAERRFWDGLRQLAADLSRLSAEYLRCLQGERIRAAGVDGGFLAVCDAMLGDLGRRADLALERSALLDGGDFFTGLTDAVGVRFPSFDVWSLPVALHELGHSVGLRVRDPQPRGGLVRDFAALAAAQRERLRAGLDGEAGPGVASLVARAENHLHELFADVFAAYTGGPAFVCTALLLRFEPGAAYEETADHPSDAARAAVLLELLPELDHNYAALAENLAGDWRAAVLAAGHPDPADEDFSHPVAAAGSVLALLRRSLPADAAYRGWAKAVGLTRRLAARAPVADIATAGVRIEDVLNAAWLARLSAPGEATRLGDRALQVARRLAPTQGGEKR